MRYPPSTTAFMERSLETLQAKDPQAQLQHQWVPYERISIHLKRAVVAAEDARFLDHEGFDWAAIQKAIAKNDKKGRVAAAPTPISHPLPTPLCLPAPP